MSGMTNQRGYSRRTFLKAAAGATGLMALAACAPVAPGAAPAAEGGAPAAEAVSVLWWRSQSGSIGDLLAKFVVDFNDANPGIVVQDEYQGDYIETMNKVIAAPRPTRCPTCCWWVMGSICRSPATGSS